MSRVARVAPGVHPGRGETALTRERPNGIGLDAPLLNPEQAAELLAVRKSWIYEAVRTGRLPCLRLGKHIRFTRQMLEDWLARQP